MKHKLPKWVPTRESLLGNRWLKWLRPFLSDPRIWHISRRGIAMGTAIGVFFGLLVPIAQIPVSAAAAVVLRANLPIAAASTFVTNPITFGPVYYSAYKIGKFVLGEPPASKQEAEAVVVQAQLTRPPVEGFWPGVRHSLERLRGVGKPLIVGMVVLSIACGFIAYFLASGIWILKTRLARRKRLNQRRKRL